MTNPKDEKELWKALDYAVFGSNEPEAVQEGMERARDQYLQERSSLGHYLTSLRKLDDQALEEMAREAGVPAERWRQWEADLTTPSAEELRQVADRLEWRSRKRELAGRLRKQAPRYRLKRLTHFHPSLLAARGELDRGGRAWASIDETTQRRIIEWGKAHGHSFPGRLAEFFIEQLSSDEAKEAWLDEILGEKSDGT